MLMSKTFCVFLFVFIAKTSSAFIKKSHRQVSNDCSHECGTHSAANGMIYNGQFVSKGLFPWKVALAYSSNHSTHPSEYFCGGVIISQTFVITVAHCLHPKQKERTKDADIVLIFGAHELNITREPGAISVPLLKSYIHEDWNPHSIRYDADIALLEIENPLPFSNLIKPICLWTGDIAVDSLNKNVGTVVFWRKTSNDEYSYDPLQMIADIVDNQKCFLEHNELLRISSKRTFCAGPRDGKTTPCEGDSGSGLYLENRKTYYLKGLVSAIWERCDPTTYTVYTDIFMFTDWIKFTAKIERTEPTHRSSRLSPWKVALIYSSNHRTHPSEYFCGGVLFSKTFVITVAHCLNPKQKERTKDVDIMLRFGAHDLDVIKDPASITLPLKKSYIHEDWNSDTNIYDADIALLEIKNPLTFSNLIKPICLWTGDNTLYETEGTVVGWGMNHLKNQSSNKPVELTVAVVNNEKCWMNHRELFTISSNRTFCGGSREGISTPCDGSSGSGLYVENQYNYYLKGLVSAIWDRCDATAYTVYTNVFMFTDWIKKTAGIVRTESTRCFVSSMNEYTCEVSAHIKHETDVLSFSDSHMEGKTDNDVTFLNFENSTVDRIPNFEKFNKLTNLKMWDVELKEITESSFTSCPNLISLGLRFNKLRKLSSGAFKDLKHLIGLGVDCNPIVEIERNAFQGLGNLQHLFMCATKLTVINEETFQPLAGLKMLLLNHTLIEKIDPNAFTTLIRLWYLNLEHGRLTSIDENIFKPLRSLQYLLLNNNLINFIHEDAFKSLTKLKRLSLRENQLEMLSSSLFLSQGKLKQLSIKENRIWFMEKGALNNFKVLTKFDARGNMCVDKLYKNAIDFEAIETLCQNDSTLEEKKLT